MDNFDMQMPDEERKRQAWLALAMGSAGLLGAPKGREWQAVGQGLQQGLLSYGDAQSQWQRGQQDKLKMQMAQEQFQAQQEERQMKIAEAKRLQGQQAADQQALGGMFQSGPQLQNMGPGGPTPANAAAVAPPSRIQQYRQAADYYAQRGNAEMAKKYNEQADKWEEEYSTTPQVMMQGGNPVAAQFGKRGGIKVAEGVAPPPKLHFTNLGDRYVAQDEYRTAPGTSLPMGQSPDSKASNALGWANYGLTKERDARAASGADKWVNDLGRGVQVNMATGETRPITANGKPIGVQQDAKLEISSKRAMNIIGEVKGMIDDATGSYVGAAVDEVAGAFGGSTQGANTIAKLKAMEGALMMAQPRMEGPQSNYDVELYRQMAGRIGNPTVPRAQKKAALDVIEGLHKKYLSDLGAGPSTGATGGWGIQEVK